MQRRGITLDPAERERIGATIREIRIAREYTIAELADSVGISRPFLTNIEAGRRAPDAKLLRKIASALTVRPIVLATGIDGQASA